MIEMGVGYFLLVTIIPMLLLTFVSGLNGRHAEKQRIKQYLWDRSCNMKNGKRESLNLDECNILRKVRDEI